MPKFIGIMLFAGVTPSGSGKYIRFIMNDNGSQVDAFIGRNSDESLRNVKALFPDVFFLLEMNVRNDEFARWKQLANARDKAWKEFTKRNGREMTPAEYHENYNTKW